MKEIKQLSKQQKAKKGKCIVFSRVSTIQQDLVQQTDQVVEEAKKSGYTDLIFIEQKESAIKLSEEERIGLQQLKEYINKGGIECVFIYEISRLSRQPKMLYDIRDFLINNNVQLVCLKPYMRLLDDDGKLSQTASIMFSIFASLSESEMMLKKERMQRGVKHMKSLGKHAGGHVMFGYKTNKDHDYVIDQQEATIVKRIFNEYVYGNKSMRLLTRDLQEEGHFKGVKFLTAVQEVYNILHRDCYCGRKRGMPAIISEALYDLSVEKRKSNELKVNHTDNMALLKGLLRDATTGLLLSSNTGCNMYYSKRHSGVAVGMHIIEPVIWEYSVKLHKKYTTLDKDKITAMLIKKIQLNARKSYTLNRNLLEIIDKKDKIEERLIMGKISDKKAEELEALLDKEENEIKSRLREIKLEETMLHKEENKLLNTKEVIIDYDNITEKKERYDIVHSVIDKIMLRRDSRYILVCSIYNKINDNIKEITIDTYNKKVVE